MKIFNDNYPPPGHQRRPGVNWLLIVSIVACLAVWALAIFWAWFWFG